MTYLMLTKSEQASIKAGTSTGDSGGLNPIQTTRSTSEFGLVNVEQQRQLRSNTEKD